MVGKSFRIFLGRWSLDPTLFRGMYEVGALLANRRIRSTGVVPVPLERMQARLELYVDEEF